MLLLEAGQIGESITQRLRENFSSLHCAGDASRQFSAGEHVLTEYSHQYTVDGFGQMFQEAGFGRYQVWTDSNQWFGVFLAEPG